MKTLSRAFFSIVLTIAITISPLNNAFALRTDDYAFNPNQQLNQFQQDLNRRQELSRMQMQNLPQSMFASVKVPDLNINSLSLRLPEIKVRDFGNSAWTYSKIKDHFNSDLKLFDQYQARISVSDVPNADIETNLTVQRFIKDQSAPEKFTQTYTDAQGNKFTIERLQQAQTNPSYQRALNYQQRDGGNKNSAFGSADVPSKENITSFQEKWILETNGVKKTSSINIESIQYESNQHRYISGYSGTINEAGHTRRFEINAQHDVDGSVHAVGIKISAAGAPTAVITWKPQLQNSEEALALLRQSIPVPFLIGPRTATRLNGVDVPENPVRLNKDGTLNSQQLPDARHLANLFNRSDMGIGITVNNDTNDEKGPRFRTRAANAIRNVFYALTGRLGQVTALREQLTALRAAAPDKFILAAGFNDPSFMGINQLRAVSIPDKTQLINVETSPSTAPRSIFQKINDKTIAVIKVPFKVVGGIVGFTLDLPVVKQVWLATRVTFGIGFGVLSGDLFGYSNPINFDKDGPAVITVNGIWNNRLAAREINNTVKNAFNVRTATTIKNATRWFGIGDLFQIVGHELTAAIDKPALDLAKAIRVGVKEKGEVFVVAHSQGSAIFKQALSLLSNKEKASIHYLGVGPEFNFDEKSFGLASADNLWNKGDPVPHLGNRVKFISNSVLPWNWGRDGASDIKNTSTVARFGAAHHFENYKEEVTKWAYYWRSR